MAIEVGDCILVYYDLINCRIVVKMVPLTPVSGKQGNKDPVQRVKYLIHCTLRMRTERWKEQ